MDAQASLHLCCSPATKSGFLMTRLSYLCNKYQNLINPYKPSDLFMGHRQTVQIQTRHCIMWCLIRNFTVCLQYLLLKFGKKTPLNTPKIGNGLLQLIVVGKSIQLKWVNLLFFQTNSITDQSKLMYLIALFCIKE